MSIRRQLGDLAKSLDSSAVGSFLSKGASAADFKTILYSDVSGTPAVVVDSSIATSVIDSAYVSSRVITAAVGLDSATTINLLDSNYMAARAGGGAGFFVYNFDATAGQTTFQDSDASGNLMSYTADGIMVFYNGVRLPASDFTATDGTSVVLGTAADSADVVTIAKWGLGSGSSSGAVWYGDRGIVAGGYNGSGLNNIQYFDISTPGNALDFGDLTVTREELSGCGVFGGGSAGVQYNTIDYVTVSSSANASDFGDLTLARKGNAALSDGTYGLWGPGFYGGAYSNVIEYVTIATPSNATDFGDATVARAYPGSGNDATYGLFAGGYDFTNVIDYVTIASPGNATDFGDLLSAIDKTSGCSDSTRTVFGGVRSAANVIQYVTTATPSNATDFGDLTVARFFTAASSNGTYATWSGGQEAVLDYDNVIDYVTIQTTSNASDFGDLNVSTRAAAGCSGSPS